jgi:uncharacterized protein (DUF3820 family)
VFGAAKIDLTDLPFGKYAAMVLLDAATRAGHGGAV